MYISQILIQLIENQLQYINDIFISTLHNKIKHEGQALSNFFTSVLMSDLIKLHEFLKLAL